MKPLVITRRLDADVVSTFKAARAALVRMRDRRFRLRFHEEDRPVFFSAELSQGKHHIDVTVQVLPGDRAGSEVELRFDGSFPAGVFARDPKETRARFEKTLLSVLKSEVKRAAGRRAWSDDETRSFVRMRRALKASESARLARREKRAEIESAFIAGLIDKDERDRLLARIKSRSIG